MIKEQNNLHSSTNEVLAPKLGFIKLIVILLGLAIILLSSFIVFKLFRGDHKDYDKKQIISSQNYYNLILPKNEEIVKISGSKDEIFILTKSSEGQKIFIIVNFEVVKIISISFGNEIKIEKNLGLLRSEKL